MFQTKDMSIPRHYVVRQLPDKRFAIEHITENRRDLNYRPTKKDAQAFVKKLKALGHTVDWEK